MKELSTQYDLHHCANLVVSSDDITFIVREALKLREEVFDEEDIWVGIKAENKVLSTWDILSLILND